MAKHGTTRSQVLETAQHLFQRQGYHATGVHQILTEAKAPKGSLYHHFPGGKQQLATESVGLGARALGEAIDAVIADSADLPAAVLAMADLLATQLEDSGYLDGCPIAGVALDAADDDPIREACRAGYDGWLVSIADALVGAGLRRPEANDLALMVLSTLEGALLLARTRRDAAVVRSVGHRIAALVGSELAS